MERAGYPARRDHREDHERLLAMMDEVIAVSPEDVTTLARSIGDHLNRWLNLHLRRHDDPMRSVIGQRRPVTDGAAP